jgi:hypothetical protein
MKATLVPAILACAYAAWAPSGSTATLSDFSGLQLSIELHSFQFIGNPKVGPQVLLFGVDRIQCGLELMVNHVENCFEL